jgi:Zn-dependent protease with chaperone function
MNPKILSVIFGLALPAASQSLLEADVQLGLNRHQQILSEYRVISGDEASERLNRVFSRMIDTGAFRGGAAVPYRLFYLDTPAINAYATGGGMMYVTAGLMQAVSANEGILAFVLGHEMVHNRNQHAAQKYMRLVNMDYQYRQLYLKSGPLAAAIYLAAARIAESKMQRDEEHEADQIGLRIAAEAGYHPDFSILATRVLRETGEQSKLAAFFGDHPRWTTREERTERNYDDATSIFERQWPSVEDSPGGRPPAISIVAPISVEKHGQSLSFSTAVRIRNLRGSAAEARLELVGEYDPEPLVIASKTYLADQTAKDPISKTFSRDTWKNRRGKQYLRLRVLQGEGQLYCSSPIKVK